MKKKRAQLKKIHNSKCRQRKINHNNNKIKIENVTNDVSSAVQNSIKGEGGHGKKTKKEQNKILSVEGEEEEKKEEQSLLNSLVGTC